MTESPTAAISPTAASTELTSKPISDSTLRRFVPTDGLFLRDEHLDQISEYAEQFALVAGVAAGPGVDYGLNVTIESRILMVSPGLAVDKSRRPLRLSGPAKIPLKNLDPDAADLWIVEILAADPVPAGREPVYGTLCDDPSSHGTLAPWRDAAVRIRIRPQQLELGAPTEAQMRSRVASAYFALERSESKPWLSPPGGKPLLEFPWHRGAPQDAPAPGAIPIAALLRDNGEWLVDTWIARRDIGGPPSRTAWEGHLGLRPWNVFIAQVLQFQAQLADVLTSAVSRESRSTSEVVGIWETLHEGMQYEQPKRNAPAGQREVLFAALERLREIADSAGGVAASAFVELPSAGVIPLPPGADPRDYFHGLFDTDLCIGVEHVRADCAIRAVEEAQHLDRIPIGGTNPKPYVKLLVPMATLTDLDTLETDTDYPWMVFTRAFGLPTMDKVPVYVVDVGDFPRDRGADPGSIEDWLSKNVKKLLASPAVATLSFPLDAWARPQTDAEFEKLSGVIKPDEDYVILGTTESRSGRRVALMSVRTGLFAVDLLDAAKLNQVRLPAFVVAELPEAIFVLRVQAPPPVGENG